MTSDLFRLNGQSIFLVGYTTDVDTARETALQLAREDGYEVHTLVDGTRKETKRQFRRLTALVRRRLTENPGLRPWRGDRKLFYDTNAARGALLRLPELEELARVMRLSPYTGVFVGIESVAPQRAFHGVRMVQGTYEELNYGWGDFHWRSSIIGLDKPSV